MTWHELTQHVARVTGQTHKAARETARALFVAIAKAAAKGERIDVPDFGVFERRTMKARRILNVDGTPMHLPPSEALRFRAARAQKRVRR